MILCIFLYTYVCGEKHGLQGWRKFVVAKIGDAILYLPRTEKEERDY